MKNNKYKDILSKLFGIVIIFLIIGNFIPTNYMVTTPGVAKELSTLITVKDGYKDNIQGDFMLTAVGSKRATVLDFVKISILDPEGYELTPRKQQIPKGMKMDQYIDIMASLMEESKAKSQAVALEKVGYKIDLKATGKGAEIIQVIEGTPAAGKLKDGDVITAVDGKEIKLASDAINTIRSKKIGEMINLTIKNNGKEKTVSLKTAELENSPDKPSIGVLIITDGLTYDFPRKIEFKTDNVVGPSAGSVFALEIYNQLTPEDITKGKKIAGTGTISLDGKIGMIDGVLQKIITADDAGADIFLVPAKNYKKAKTTTRDIKLVKVENIDEVINFLKNEL